MHGDVFTKDGGELVTGAVGGAPTWFPESLRAEGNVGKTAFPVEMLIRPVGTGHKAQRARGKGAKGRKAAQHVLGFL